LDLPVLIVFFVFVIEEMQKIQLINVLVLIESKNNVSANKHYHFRIILGYQNFWND
jgi:hypothetical protein